MAIINVDWQLIVNVAIYPALAIAGWFLRQLWDANAKLREDITQLSISIPQTYMPRVEAERIGERIFAKLDRIETKLDRKADKE